MALGKSLLTQRGYVHFWILGNVQIDGYSKSAMLTLYGFASREHSDMEGSVPIEIEYINIYPDKFEDYFGDALLKELDKNNRTEGYRVFKELVPNFADAIDLIYTEEV